QTRQQQHFGVVGVVAGRDIELAGRLGQPPHGYVAEGGGQRVGGARLARTRVAGGRAEGKEDDEHWDPAAAQEGSPSFSLDAPQSIIAWWARQLSPVQRDHRSPVVRYGVWENRRPGRAPPATEKEAP